jgi:hypothetical protein
MTEKKRVYEAQVMMNLPPLRLVLGDVPLPDPACLRNAGQNSQKVDPKMEGTVKRLIAHLEDEK